MGERHVREDENDLKNKLLQQSSSIADDDEIAVVQVGEAPRQFQQNPQNSQKKD
jgi:hypothetical protein